MPRPRGGKPFTGGVRFMKPHSDWLAAQDLAGRCPFPIRITEVLRFAKGTELAGRRSRADFYALDFEVFAKAGWRPTTKLWKLNVTNTRTLWARFGADVEAWRGQEIHLVLEPTKSPAGGPMVYGIRLQPTEMERDAEAMAAHMRRLESPDPRTDEEVADDAERDHGEDPGCSACGWSDGHQDGCPEAPEESS